MEPFPQQLATSLFSFLYHLASYESGCEALVASGLIEPLLKVVLWPGQDDHITVSWYIKITNDVEKVLNQHSQSKITFSAGYWYISVISTFLV